MLRQIKLAFNADNRRRVERRVHARAGIVVTSMVMAEDLPSFRRSSRLAAARPCRLLPPTRRSSGDGLQEVPVGLANGVRNVVLRDGTRDTVADSRHSAAISFWRCLISTDCIGFLPVLWGEARHRLCDVSIGRPFARRIRIGSL